MKGIIVEQIVGAGVSSMEIREAVAARVVSDYRPETVLDIGCGVGNYGAHLKMLMPSLFIVGVDAWMPYLLQDLAQRFYDVRIHGDIRDVLLKGVVGFTADLTLCMDVVEHFPKEEAVELLERPFEHFLVSTPLFDYKQGIVGGNVYEEHKCWFTEEEMTKLGFDTLLISDYAGNDGQSGPIGLFERRMR